MQRRIVDYAIDEAGERIAVLECGHPQHIRHNPPFINRPWTQSEEGRAGMLGQPLECVRCDRGERALVWYSAPLGDGVMASSRLAEIEEAFAAAFGAAGRPVEMAVLKRHEMQHSLQCEVTVYFSPAAAELARAFGARPTLQPGRASLELVAGDVGCWEVLF